MKKFAVCLLIVLCLSSGQVFAVEDSSDTQELMNRIQDLEKRINELTEESRARRKLEITEQEKQEREKEVLDAVSRDYSLDPKHTLNIDYSFNYTYQPFERYDTLQAAMDRMSDHTVVHTITTSYSVLDNMGINFSIPFRYEYQKMGTDDKLDERDVGDISVGVSFQPRKSKPGDIRNTISLSIAMPTGKSPYKILSGKELSTGNGVYAFSVAANFTKQVDPIVLFWNLGYTHNMDPAGVEWRVSDTTTIDKVKIGDSVSIGGGFAQSLSYRASVNYSFNYAYKFGPKYYVAGAEDPIRTGDTVSAMLNIGMGWRVSQKTTLSFSVGYNLTGSSFSLSFRMPFTFIL